MMKNFLILVPLLLCLYSGTAFVFVSPVDARSNEKLQGSHGDRSVMSKSCRACHRGMNMAVSGDEKVCLACHGEQGDRQAMIDGGYLKDTGGLNLQDISVELSKTYNHPVLSVQGVHQKNEALPEEIVNAVRHSECVDCHNPHLTEKNNLYRGIKGKRVGNFIADIENEYELCYRCHAESANLPGTSTNKHEEFMITNPSYHPVEGEGRNTLVISLKDPYVTQKKKPNEISIISCSDCHGSDSPDAPKGPHGSDYPGLLVLHYEMEDGRQESDYTYALCYKCHERSSILSDESFPYHALHIQGRLGQGGTSCFTCHDAHGSRQYPSLIRFNDEVVFENSDGRLKYEAQGYSARHGSCSLTCHGVEHDPAIEGAPGEY